MSEWINGNTGAQFLCHWLLNQSPLRNARSTRRDTGERGEFATDIHVSSKPKDSRFVTIIKKEKIIFLPAFAMTVR